jgi:hypothetical protein
VEYDEWDEYDGRATYQSIENLPLENEYEDVRNGVGSERSLVNRHSVDSSEAASYWD